ncbi:hypothetical protein Shyd_57960 [Streptomyces hydrogenans]|uniref:Uncharacterized protein n=1 Tax=Streptomyces hydrogenans TaxID=1873719 RepID=A0ABQ3PHD9_9ACTN|nr:hypothetical protein Shyd_57960 [Streptomyces hydrogenans]
MQDSATSAQTASHTGTRGRRRGRSWSSRVRISGYEKAPGWCSGGSAEMRKAPAFSPEKESPKRKMSALMRSRDQPLTTSRMASTPMKAQVIEGVLGLPSIS